MIRKILFVLTGLVLLAVVLGYGGNLHPVFDSIAVFRAYATLSLIGMGVLLLGLRAWRLGAAAVLVGAGVFASLGFYPLGQGGAAEANGAGHIYTHYQKNLLFVNHAKKKLARDIIKRNADVVTLQEVHTERNAIIKKRLERHYPSHHYCDFVGVGGVEVLSKWPMVEGSAQCLWGTALMQVEGPEGPLWVASTHLHWVYPYENAAQVADLVPQLAALEGPKIIGGDFNTVPWTDSFGDFARAADVERIGEVDITIVTKSKLIRVPIDHVLATGGHGKTEILPLLGSDHRGVWAEFSMRP